MKQPLGKKAFPKIPHLPGSRTGSSDRVAPPELARRCTERATKGDVIVVQEKLDGSCVAVARLGAEVVALGREGWRAAESRNPGRQMFHRWVTDNTGRFAAVLRDGEWLVGEWLALAHSTRYRLAHEPFVAFDLFTAAGALATDALDARLAGRFARPALLHRGDAVSIATVNAALGEHGGHGAVDAVEGAVWRVERGEVVLHRAKFVRHGKVDGALLPENSGRPAVWNWSDGLTS
ncbi:MAG: hypothetical protein JNJ54_31515 [Myxococcaceae bacterium]|nr:hypothetical protein [Myxococcaceae bacterium]